MTRSDATQSKSFRVAWATASVPLKAVFWLVIVVGAWFVVGPALLYFRVQAMVQTGHRLSESGSLLGVGANAGSAKQWSEVLTWSIERLGGAVSGVLVGAIVGGVLIFACYIVLARNLIRGQRYSRVTYSILAGISIIGFAMGALESVWSIIALIGLIMLWLPPTNRAFALPKDRADARNVALQERFAGAKSAAGQAVADTGSSVTQAAVNVGQTVGATARVVAKHAVPVAKERIHDGTETLKAAGEVAKRRLEQNETAYVVGGLAARMARRAKGAAQVKIDQSKRAALGYSAPGEARLQPGETSETRRIQKELGEGDQTPGA